MSLPPGRFRLALPLIIAALLATVLAPGSQAATDADRRAGGLDKLINLWPLSFIAGEPVTVTGNVGKPGVRTVVLKRLMRDIYLPVERGTTDANGDFTFRIAGPGSPTPLAVFAEGAGRTPLADVEPRDQQVDLSFRPRLGVPLVPTTVTVTAAPAREGRPILLERRVDGDQWQRVGRKLADAAGQARFSVGTQNGDVFRAIAGVMTDGGLAAFPSFPTYRPMLLDLRAPAAARRTVAQTALALTSRREYNQPGPVNAGNTFKWYPLSWDDDWERGESMNAWQDYSNGTGRAAVMWAMLTLDSGPSNRGEDNTGDTAATRTTGAEPYGRWEIRMRVPRWGDGDDQRVLAQLVPDGAGIAACSDDTITFADFRGYGRGVDLGAIRNGQHWGFTKGNVVRNRDNWHTYAVEVKPDRITWFVDAHATATLPNPEAISGKPLHLRLAMVGDGAGVQMAHNRVGVDWARHWDLDRPGVKQQQIANAPKATRRAC